MQNRKSIRALLAGTGLAFLFAGSPALGQQDAQSGQGSEAPKKEKHHSKAKGAVVGGAGGAVVGGKKGAAVGALGGAAVQHHKNKKAEKKAEKAQEAK